MGHLTWPLNPPKQKKNQEKTKKQQKTNKEGLGPSEVEKKKKQEKENKENKKNKKTQKYQKKSFWVVSQFFLCLGGCPKFPFFDNLAKKARTPKKLYK